MNEIFYKSIYTLTISCISWIILNKYMRVNKIYMKKTSKTLQKVMSKIENVINGIETPINIIKFDMAYIILLIIAPFTLTLFNIWHFSKISANQMLAYVGSMSSAFCTINLALLTYSFNVRAKNESERLKRKTIAHANTQEIVIINRYVKSLQIQIPFIIITENPYGDIRYEVTSLSLLNSKTNLYFFRDPDSIETSGGKNTTTPIININIVLKEGKEMMIDSKFTIVLSVDITNDGVITKNNILLETEMEIGKYNQFKILRGTQL